MLSYGSVCSGIEAATAAWDGLGWRPAWFAEIDPFPAAVLAHHYPNVPNLGDMTCIAARILSGEIEAPDILVGGTPCQAFSLAGFRSSMNDARGQLSLSFVRLANAIDVSRAAARKPPAVILWENVPGVLSTKDNAFGCFLGAMVGESVELVPSGAKWTDSGCVYGPERTAAWRVLDAQYFGLAQRRRRLFVVASARTGFDSAAILFEFEGLRRDTAPRREPGKNTPGTVEPGASGGGEPRPDTRDGIGPQPVGLPETVGALTAGAGPNAHGHSGPQTVQGAVSGHILAFGGNNTAGPIDVTPALLAQPGSGYKVDFDSETLVAFPAFMSGTQYAAARDLAPGLCAENPTAVAFSENQRGEISLADIAPALSQGGGKPGQGYPTAFSGQVVRRLMPVECERLQGFHDHYTAISVRGRPAADGPRYKAIGNSMAVPVMRWIGARIDRALGSER